MFRKLKCFLILEVCQLPKSNTRHKTIIHKLLINKQLIQALTNMKKKELYIAPQTELVPLTAERGIIMASGDFKIQGFEEDTDIIS